MILILKQSLRSSLFLSLLLGLSLALSYGCGGGAEGGGSGTGSTSGGTTSTSSSSSTTSGGGGTTSSSSSTTSGSGPTSGSTTGGAVVPYKFTEIQNEIFTPTCAASCHGASKSGNLDLSTGSSYGNLVSVPPSNTTAKGKGDLRVYPGDPNRSFLVRKLRGTLDSGEGNRMPLGGTPLTDYTIQRIEEWIRGGAPNN